VLVTAGLGNLAALSAAEQQAQQQAACLEPADPINLDIRLRFRARMRVCDRQIG
jgi:hypothetical protein